MKMLSFHRNYFRTMAHQAHRSGLFLRRAGDYAGAYCKFVERDILMRRAREDLK